ncbi:MAG: YkvA family protein [Leptolyngbya sp. IPPAS B-1204]|uniref:DUF1232 domain-containing protein n=1 Tax=Leptolyngbya sp. NK1-12 TaxID=2547451 RepID=A0AA96WIL1_9CYAN|nr:YkvA family protein [Leptolyngbya sp. NK1-12]MBF2048741.1 DUF1232 domain-containing protein [Elainella sp. C42_A2020_010]RNJ67412.1 MAG: DUF1232 domain-containing protein [Leptolyngbya sp. IPPAS B-1204]WNZ25355.1 DUF1232 domain-containing protein [Leptolyngbya sp. NK1-12]
MKFLNQFVYNFIRKTLRNSKYRWLLIAASLVYLISPLDISPDVIPVLGWLDDGVIVTLLATEVSQFLIEQRKARKEKTTASSSVS